MKAHLRARAQDALGDEGIAVGPLTLEPRSGEVLLDGTPLDLSPVEYRLLETLVRGKGRLVSREELLAKVWGYVAGDTRTVDVHIFRLRRKIEPDPEHPRLVHTVRGRGYRLLWTPEDRR